MAHVLMCWELGANLGHIDRLLALARPLAARGHRVSFVLRDLSRVHQRVVKEGFSVGQAPVWLPRLANPPRLGNYSAVLASAGWLDATGLAGLLSGWRTWFDVLQPDVLVCDHAPTALLAARGSGVTTWAIGSSFEIPPTGAGWFPPFEITPGDTPGNTGSAATTCSHFDQTVLTPTNAALALCGRPPLPRLTALFDGAQRALSAWPELAHYSGYGPDVHWAGPNYLGDSGSTPVWPQGSGPQVFAYLDASCADFEPLLTGLGAAGARLLVHAKGLAGSAAQRLGGPRIRFEAEPVRMDAAVALADVVVSHGGQGSLAAAALAGKPQLLLPRHVEQAMGAARLTQTGAALVLEPGQGGGGGPALRRLLTEPAFKAEAQALAARHAGHAPGLTVATLVGLIEGRLAPPCA